MLLYRFGTMFAIAGIAAAFLVSPATAQTITGEEIRTQLIGKTLVGKRMGMTMRMTLNPDGTVNAKSSLMSGEGTWAIEDDKLCIFMPRRPGTQDPCQSFTRIDNVQVRSSGGATFSVE